MNGVTQRELSFLLLLWGLSNPRIAELCEMPWSFSIKMHSETQVSGRLGMSGGRSPRHAQNPLSGERGKTLSITHHALSPSHHHLYSISSHQLTTTSLLPDPCAFLHFLGLLVEKCLFLCSPFLIANVYLCGKNVLKSSCDLWIHSTVFTCIVDAGRFHFIFFLTERFCCNIP